MHRLPTSSVLLCAFVALWFHQECLAQSTTRISISSTGVEANDESFWPSICGDGTLIAFGSLASNLVPNDTNNTTDVFVHNTITGSTVRVSVSSTGEQANSNSGIPWIAGDGSVVAFNSWASNLVPNDTNDTSDVFVHRLSDNSTIRVSVDSSGTQVYGFNDYPVLSHDGRYMCFLSAFAFSQLDGNNNWSVYVKDLLLGGIELVDINLSGTSSADALSTYARISDDGRFVTFTSSATDLVSGDSNGLEDVFVRDLSAQTTTLVSVALDGSVGNSSSAASSISQDGRTIAFWSFASNLVPSVSTPLGGVFLREMQAGQTTLVCGDAGGPSVSSDALVVCFPSNAALAPDDTNMVSDIYVKPAPTSAIVRASVASNGTQSNDESLMHRVAANGRFVTFMSRASNLVPHDTNGRADIFVRDLRSTATAFCFGDGSLPTACPCAPPDSVPNPSGATGAGCANPFNADGAVLSAYGSLVPDTVRFECTIAPTYGGFAFLAKGTADDGAGVALGDGVRCVDGALLRFGGHFAGTNGDALGRWTYPNSVQTLAVSTITAQPAMQPAYYQLVYRSAHPGFCSPGTINLSNGLQIDW